MLERVERVWMGLLRCRRFGFHLLLRLTESFGSEKVPVLSECAGSVTWNVLKRTGTPAVAGPEVVVRGISVGGMWVLMMLLHVGVWVVLGVWCAGRGLLAEGGGVSVGWRRFVRVAGRDAPLIEGPTRSSGFILVYVMNGCCC